MPAAAVRVHDLRVDDDGVRAVSADEVVLDVLFDGRRIWSFWLHRDGESHAGIWLVRWPPALRRFLNGTTTLTFVAHVSGEVVHEEEVHLGNPSTTKRIAVVNRRGLPMGIDKSLRLAQTFDTRSAEHVAPLLDAVEEVLAALATAGVEAFPAYGTLLGAVREGQLIGHDSDADLGYVSEHDHPVDVIRESFRLQRSLAEMGYRTSRYSGAAFKVDVEEADGSVRGLDVFGGFLAAGNLHLMGEIRTPFRREWIFPLGSTVLEGRTLPAPADTDRFLTATYGSSWRVPDPAYKFGTPAATHRRLNGWFRGTRVKREAWDRAYSRLPAAAPEIEPSPFAQWVLDREGAVPGRLVDVGCGRAVDALWFARQGSTVVGLDYATRGGRAVAAKAAREGLAFELRAMNLCELRSVLAEGATLTRAPGPTVVTARHVVDATDETGRQNLWRLAEMATRPGGRLYLEVLVSRADGGDVFARREHLHALPLRHVVAELQARGATVVARQRHQEDGPDGTSGPRTGRLVVEWRR